VRSLSEDHRRDTGIGYDPGQTPADPCKDAVFRVDVLPCPVGVRNRISLGCKRVGMRVRVILDLKTRN